MAEINTNMHRIKHIPVITHLKHSLLFFSFAWLLAGQSGAALAQTQTSTSTQTQTSKHDVLTQEKESDKKSTHKDGNPQNEISWEDEFGEDTAWGEEFDDDNAWDAEFGDEEFGQDAFAASDDQHSPPFSPINGFVELAYSHRLQTDPALKRPQTLADARVQLQWDYDLEEYGFESAQIKTRADVYFDGVKNNTEIQIRELAWQGSLADIDALGELGQYFDAKIGQQVLTWGTGDYLFLNDLFPKDYQSFFSGRDDDYLKAPSFAIKLSGYFDWVNIDVVVTPRFTPDNFINGEYYSFFSPQTLQPFTPIELQTVTNVAPEFHVASENRPTSPEYHLRLHKSIGANEVALYGYKGHSPLPDSADPLGRPRFSGLNVYGFSWVRPWSEGLFKMEYAYQNALEDSQGNKPRVPNSIEKYLLGYEKELYTNLTGSIQWYTERTKKHATLLSVSSWPDIEPEKIRNVLTTQFIYQAMRQTLTLQWFNFYSPTDEDGYSRFRATYSPTDKWQVSGGVNWFYGNQKHTFFAQFEDASNAFLSFRYFLGD